MDPKAMNLKQSARELGTLLGLMVAKWRSWRHHGIVVPIREEPSCKHARVRVVIYNVCLECGSEVGSNGKGSWE